MKCPKCGAEFKEGKFCPECGEQILEHQEENIYPSELKTNVPKTSKLKELLTNLLIGFAITVGSSFVPDKWLLIEAGIIVAIAVMILVSKIPLNGGAKAALLFVSAIFAFAIGKNAVLQIMIHPDVNFKQLMIFYVVPLTLGSTIIVSTIRNMEE